MVDAASGFGWVWSGIESLPTAIFALGSDVCGDAGEPAGDGFHWTADDDEPVPHAAQDVVAAADGGDGDVRVLGSAQRWSGALELTYFKNRKITSVPVRKFAGTLLYCG